MDRPKAAAAAAAAACCNETCSVASVRYHRACRATSFSVRLIFLREGQGGRRGPWRAIASAPFLRLLWTHWSIFEYLNLIIRPGCARACTQYGASFHHLKEQNTSILKGKKILATLLLYSTIFTSVKRERFAGQGEPFLLLCVSFRLWRLRGCVAKVPKMSNMLRPYFCSRGTPT